MNNNYDVLVIGGGINGCSIAYQLSKRNRKTAVLEKNKVGAEASSAAAGMLGAQSEIKEKSPFFDFARTSRDSFPELIPELEKKSGITVSYVRNGMLKIADTAREKQHLEEMYYFQKQAGQQVEWLSVEQVGKMDPAIQGSHFGALYIEGDGQVKAPDLTKAYAGAAVAEGADLYEYTAVLSLVYEGERVVGVTTPKGEFYADQVVLAGGAWSQMISPLAEKLPPLIPVKGECVSLWAPKAILEKTVHASDFYVVPKQGGSIIIGATEREGEMGKEVSAEAVQSLLTKSFSLVPGLREAAWETAWTGVRPQTFDGMPYIGQTAVNGLWMAAGHYRNGILLSAVTGIWMADLLDGSTGNTHWMSAFSPQRYSAEKEEEKVGINH